MMKTLLGSVTRLCLGAALLVASLPALPALSAVSPEEQEEAEKQEIERLEKWPKVDQETVKTDVERLRKARTAGMGEAARESLTATGAGVVPLLLPKLGVEKDEAARKRIAKVLDGVTGAEHTRLLAEYFGDRSRPVRSWALRRVALFPDDGVRAAAEKAYQAATKKKKRSDSEEEEVFAAALCAASTGSFTGFEAITGRASKEWSKNGKAIHVALAALRGREATKRVAPLLTERDSRKEKVAALRLLAACGEGHGATSVVAPLLDSTDNSLRVAAINALRGIVDGDPPLDKLSVFEAIERANKWKARL